MVNSSKPAAALYFWMKLETCHSRCSRSCFVFLEEGEIERVGGDKPVPVDARVLVATHRNLEEMVRQGTFRADLFHRVYVFPIVLPPLRERPEEITVLAEYFSTQVAAQNGWRLKHFSSRVAGNSEALHVARQRARIAKRSRARPAAFHRRNNYGRRSKSGLAGAAQWRTCEAAASGTLTERMESYEKEVLLAELRRHHHHMTNVARALGLERSHLYKKCQQLGIDLRSERK